MTLMQLLLLIGFLGLLPIAIFYVFTRWLGRQGWVRRELEQRYGPESRSDQVSEPAEPAWIANDLVDKEQPSAQVIPFRGKRDSPQ